MQAEMSKALAGVGSGASGLATGAINAASSIAGLGTFDNQPVARWIIPYLQYARTHGWSGTVTSGYRSKADQARVCSTGVQPCATPGKSHHQGKAYPSGAVDVTNPEQLAAILKRKPGPKLLQWAGSADPPHFSHHYGGGY